jgi:hypothetical protein
MNVVVDMRWIGIFMEREIYLFVIKPKGVDDLSIPRCPTVPVRSYSIVGPYLLLSGCEIWIFPILRVWDE